MILYGVLKFYAVTMKLLNEHIRFVDQNNIQLVMEAYKLKKKMLS
jgi:hypothetical protein